MKTEEIRSKTDSELDYDMAQMQKELFGLRFRAGVESVQNPARIRDIRRAIARVKTVLQERKTGVRGQEPR